MATNPKTTSPIEFTSLAKGFVTDSSPLNYQPDSASVLENFNLNLNGSMQRRNGLSKILPAFIGSSPYEPTYLTTGVSGLPAAYYDKYVGKMGHYVWKGAGETSTSTLVVIANSNSRLSFYLVSGDGITQVPADMGDGGTSNMLILSGNNQPSTSPYNKIDFAVSGSKLLICNGSEIIYSVEFKGGVVSPVGGRLTVRDQWGVYDTLFDGVDLTGGGVKIRPNAPNPPIGPDFANLQRHLYNLNNQGWADLITPLVGALNIPAREFWNASNLEYTYDVDSFWPSNSDTPTEYTYPNTGHSTEKTIDRYHAKDQMLSGSDNRRAPQGHYIIDLLQRSTSRIDRYKETSDIYVERGDPVTGSPALWSTALPATDQHALWGPSALASFAGRVWYSGISNASASNDWDGAPDLSKLVLFSQLADSDSASLRCYQVGDPTSKDNPDIVDTDGGFVVIPEAEVILKLVPLGNSLVVVASNGIWTIDGGGDTGFTATGYRVSKISSNGCVATGSVVVVEESMSYFAQRGIMQVSGTSLDGMSATDISQGRILDYYHSLSPNELTTCTSAYDPETREVSWNFLGATEATELKLSLDLNAFFKHVWQGSLMGNDVLPIATLPLPKVLAGVLDNLVVVNGVEVVAGGEAVAIGSATNTASPVSAIRLIQQVFVNTNTTLSINLGFAVVDPASFNDWESFPTNHNPAGIEAWEIPSPTDTPATIVTGYLTGGDTQRVKQIPYITMLFNKTETGFEEDIDGELSPIGASSCKVQAQWEWTNSARSNRWGKEFQGYRHRRFYMPEDGADQYEDGHSVVTTKNKLRGKGRALSLKMTTEPGLDCQILGWSFNLSMGNAV
tara:strand:+ start:8790 stop:11324 length:2535 start_codon:yes stop_codon:yes gene_type:complete